jgi:hypothetical protein
LISVVVWLPFFFVFCCGGTIVEMNTWNNQQIEKGQQLKKNELVNDDESQREKEVWQARMIVTVWILW